MLGHEILPTFKEYFGGSGENGKRNSIHSLIPLKTICVPDTVLGTWDIVVNVPSCYKKLTGRWKPIKTQGDKIYNTDKYRMFCRLPHPDLSSSKIQRWR